MGLSATQRFTYTLLQLGYLRRDEASRLYALSPKTLEFGRRYRNPANWWSGRCPISPISTRLAARRPI